MVYIHLEVVNSPGLVYTNQLAEVIGPLSTVQTDTSPYALREQSRVTLEVYSRTNKRGFTGEIATAIGWCLKDWAGD